MFVVYANNPDHGLYNGVHLLRENGVIMESRIGPVIVAPRPVTTVYPTPRARVSHSVLRDANPFFHLMEAMWMLAGRRDVDFVARYAARMKEFSDDGSTLNGAYGYRWRRHFDFDQLTWIAKDLKRDRNSRRSVLTMWDPEVDMELAANGGKDVPCNTQAYFRVRGGLLDMTVTCRSNDIVWGCYGANVVHFSVMQELMAALIGCGVGTYYQVSNNYHAYSDREDTRNIFKRSGELLDPRPMTTSPWIDDGEAFLQELNAVLGNSHGPAEKMKSRFLADVVLPMIEAHRAHKDGDTPAAIARLRTSGIDWHVAGTAWLERRRANKTTTAETRA